MTPLLARAADRHFEKIYSKHVGDVYRYALVVLRNPQDAEDVTQTTFLNAYRAMQQGERPEVPKNWLIAIAHNVCRQRFRQAQRRPQESPLFEETLVDEEHEETYSAEDIQRALGYLAFNQRAALVMRELEGRSYQEIADIMGLSIGAIETLIFRARRALREQLEGSLTCVEAERFLSKQTDGMLSRGERGQLRAHLRACEECAALARRQRASRGAMKSLFGALPLPASLLPSTGVGLATKAAALVCAGAVVGTGGYEVQKAVVGPTHAKAKVAAAAPKPAPAVVAPVSAATSLVTTSIPNHGRTTLPTQARPTVPPGRAKAPHTPATGVGKSETPSKSKAHTPHATPVHTPKFRSPNAHAPSTHKPSVVPARKATHVPVPQKAVTTVPKPHANKHHVAQKKPHKNALMTTTVTTTTTTVTTTTTTSTTDGGNGNSGNNRGHN